MATLNKASSTFSEAATLEPWTEEAYTPFVGLVNPNSGGHMGAAILEVCWRTEYFKDRMFIITDVVKGGEPLQRFRARLDEAKDLAKKSGDPELRPRLVCGGGDGTPSFALNLVFRALLIPSSGVEDPTNDKWAWSDEEIKRYFPALVQMPLGTGNDLGASLGWGRKYPGHTMLPLGSDAHDVALKHWFDIALRKETKVVNFDVWAFIPPAGQDTFDAKVCELAEVKQDQHGDDNYVMRPSGPVVPFFCLLYACYGWMATVVARFQIKRHDSQMDNLLEYGKVGEALLVRKDPPQVRQNLTGMSATIVMDVGEEPGCGTDLQYFPPRVGEEKAYHQVGFLNVNSFSGGLLHGKDRASFKERWCLCGAGRRPVDYSDGKADFFRTATLGKFLGKTGNQLQTDKAAGGSFSFEAAKGKGIFLQYDGEARFVFHPDGAAWRMDVTQILRIPMVVAKVPPGRAPAGPVTFEFVGDSSKVERSRARLMRWVRGDVAKEMNATEEEIRRGGFLLPGDDLPETTGEKPHDASTVPKQNETAI
eukprot:TRINITY_DN55193_c0_g1_i1.p1 TRINITY_DN55193_c0_g1~~TRINITY_DN55193_c0_g1_i1.p1  ORF type:complete len:535 (-),score=97.40 TRINITY_DN55193_c0_g1_i1:68-1672(-)